MTEGRLEQYTNELVRMYQEVNTRYIQKVAENIVAIGGLSPTSINRIAIMSKVNEDVSDINKMLAKALGVGVKLLYRMYDEAIADTYTDENFKRALSEKPFSKDQKRRLEWFALGVAMQTAGEMRNLSNTTIVSEAYRHAIDLAILAVTSGIGDYQSETRQILKDVGEAGVQVQYPSGYRRRLDTAVRQNVTNGAKQIAQNGSIMMGDMLGYDAYEISAHARSAPDHEPIQGHVFLKAEFDKMQNEEPFQDIDGRHYAPIRRAIGEWNCMHTVLSFSTEYSTRKWTQWELDRLAEANAEGTTYKGKHYSLYQAGQMMRQLETQVRRQKDVAVAATQAGDDVLRRMAQNRIDHLMAEYYEIAKASGIKPRPERTTVPGFKRVKL